MSLEFPPHILKKKTSLDSFKASLYGLFDQNSEILCLDCFYDYIRVGVDDKCLFNVCVDVQQLSFAEKTIQATIYDEQVFFSFARVYILVDELYLEIQ